MQFLSHFTAVNNANKHIYYIVDLESPLVLVTWFPASSLSVTLIGLGKPFKNVAVGGRKLNNQSLALKGDIGALNFLISLTPGCDEVTCSCRDTMPFHWS